MLNCLTCGILSSFCSFLSDFEGFWVCCLLFLIIEGQGQNPYFELLQHLRNFPLENRIALLSIFTAKRLKDSRFFSFLPIENPSKRPGASPRGKLNSHSFWNVKMRNKIHMCQSETVFLIVSYWVNVVKQRNNWFKEYLVSAYCLTAVKVRHQGPPGIAGAQHLQVFCLI